MIKNNNLEIEKNSLKNNSDYKGIYSNIIIKVDEVLSDLSNINIQHIDIKKKNEEVENKLNKLRSEFVNDVEKLNKNVIWDRFTIAFFGETNAGKSTIIESLRISMLEDEKLENFKLQKFIDEELTDLTTKYKDLINNKIEVQKTKIEKLNSKITLLEKRAEILKNIFWAKWLNIFRSWFGLLPLIFFEKKIKNLTKKINEIESTAPESDSKAVILFKKIKNKTDEKDMLYDGKIIGTGSQDFTQSCIEYSFNQEEKPFTLIDVPGIEGNEGKYETMIMDAVSKAHSIFYVCSSGKLPESGTIKKIKKYLKNQSEVYFLLNERKNTYSFENECTFEAMHPTANEFKANISKQMHLELGEYYKGCYSLQGLMAFCSKANIQEDDRNFKFQKKLLEKFGTSEDLYSISQLEKVELLIKTQLNGMEIKIINANIQKAIGATVDFKKNIEEIRQTDYSNDFVLNIEKELSVVNNKNYNEFKILQNELNQISIRLSNSAVESLRTKLYHLVDNKEKKSQLNNSDLTKSASNSYQNKEAKIKFIAKCYSQYVFEDLSQAYTIETQKNIKKFTEDVKSNIHKMQSNIKEITSVKFSHFDHKKIGELDALFDIEWLKYLNVLKSVGGMAMTGDTLGNIVGPVVGAIIGFLFVGIRWLMNPESPESKAKRKIDKNLLDMKTEIKAKLDETNKNIINDCQENVINSIKIMLDDNLKGIKAIQIILDTKTNQLDKLIKEIKNTKK